MDPPFILAKCKTKAAFSAKLKTPHRLDLEKIKKSFETIMETAILIIIKEENVEIIVHGYGELMFKNCSDTDLMEKIAKKVYAIGLGK